MSLAATERRQRYAARDEANVLAALSRSRFLSAREVRRRMARSIPSVDTTEALKRLHTRQLVQTGPLPSGKNGWRLTAAGWEKRSSQ